MSRPLRILELRSVKGTGGGPDKTILLGAQRADRRRFEVTVAYVRDSRDADYRIDSAARRHAIDYVEIIERHSLDWAILAALRQLIRSRQIDLVHSHDYKTNALALVLARTDQIIPLTTVHGWSGHSLREQFLYYPVDRRMARWFPRVIAVSTEIAVMLHDAGVQADRIVVLPNGIDHHAFRRSRGLPDAVRAQFGVKPGQFVIGAVGRLEPEKRFDLLIDAVARVASGRPHVRLLIAGDGALRSRLESKAKRLLQSSQCQLIGHCSDVKRFHNCLDLFVMSSDHEGSPNVVLEAMAMETPVLATRVGGTVQMVRDRVDGLLIPPNDSAALARAIEQVIDDPGAAAVRARAARQRVEQKLSFDARQEALETVYELLAQHHLKRDRSNGDELGLTCARP